MTDYQYAWMFYLVGALGCCLATWWLFRRAGRAWVHFFVITVMVLLLTPYAIDAESMIMAPAIYTLVFGFITEGFLAIKPVVKLMLGLWLGALVLSLIYQMLTRGRAADAVEYHPYSATPDHEDYDYSPKNRHLTRDLSREERQARHELLHGEEPIRAIR